MKNVGGENSQSDSFLWQQKKIWLHSVLLEVIILPVFFSICFKLNYFVATFSLSYHKALIDLCNKEKGTKRMLELVREQASPFLTVNRAANIVPPWACS